MSMSHPFIVTAVLAVLLSSSIVSAEYKWNGSDWIWTDDSKDDGGGGGLGEAARAPKRSLLGRPLLLVEGTDDCC